MDLRIFVRSQEGTGADLVGWTDDLVTAVGIGTITGGTDFDVVAGKWGTNETISSTVEVAEIPVDSSIVVLVNGVLELEYALVEACDL